jgi:hypothetical protein
MTSSMPTIPNMLSSKSNLNSRSTLVHLRLFKQGATIKEDVMFRNMSMAVFATMVFASAAYAGDEPEQTGREFTTPSGNISCTVLDVSLEGGSGPSKRLYCVRNLPETIVVILDERGAETYETEGDQPFTNDIRILHYGQNWFNGGFSCDSSKIGIFCSHSDYGAFQLSRKGMKKLR